MDHELELEVFRAGDYGAKGRWSEDELESMAGDYDRALHEAPVTLDHAQSGPALGWVAALARRGDRLVARLRGLSEDLLANLRKGAFKKRSVEIYGRLPETGRPYLKAVSFLGAASPAVRGLPDAVFAEPVAEAGAQNPPAEFASFEFTDADLQENKAIEPWTGFAQLTDELRARGAWMPAWDRMGIEAFCHSLAAASSFEIDAENPVAPIEWFAAFLRALPSSIPSGEAAPLPRSEALGIPAGGRVSPASIDLHRRAIALREGRPAVSYAEALRECARHF